MYWVLLYLEQRLLHLQKYHQKMISQTINQNIIVNSISEDELTVVDSVERGKITITLKALKKLILDNKDTIKDILVGLNIVQEN